jgi:hypothetical protein
VTWFLIECWSDRFGYGDISRTKACRGIYTAFSKDNFALNSSAFLLGRTRLETSLIIAGFGVQGITGCGRMERTWILGVFVGLGIGGGYGGKERMWMDQCDSFSPLVPFGVCGWLFTPLFPCYPCRFPLHNNLHLRNENSENLKGLLLAMT